MQDASIGQKSGNIEAQTISSGSEKTKTTYFEIFPESSEVRKKSKFDFNVSVQSELPVYVEPEIQAGTPLKNNPANRIAELLINAKTLLQHGDKDLARVLVYEGLKLDSKNSAVLKMAKCFLHPQKELQSLIKIQQQICSTEMSFENYSDLAHLYYQAGLDEKALEKYFESLNLILNESESLFEVYKNMGNILTRAGDFDGAEEYFHKAFTLAPDSDVLLVNLGTLFIQKNDYDSALERFRSAVSKNPKNDKAWVGLALVHQQMGDFNLSFANIEKAMDLNPTNRTAVHLFSSWCTRDHKYFEAIEVVENYLSNVELDEELSLVLIHLFCKTNQFAAAHIEAERVLLWNPDSQQMRDIQIEISNLMGKEGS